MRAPGGLCKNPFEKRDYGVRLYHMKRNTSPIHSNTFLTHPNPSVKKTPKLTPSPPPEKPNNVLPRLAYADLTGEGARGLPYTAVLKYLQQQRTTRDTLADLQRASLLKGARGQNL